MATIKDVSRLANVSTATVSRVLNGGVSVSEAKRVAVLEAVHRLGYEPNAFARSLVTNRSGAIGVIVSEVSSGVYGAFVQGIESVVEAQGMHMIVSSGHGQAKREAQAFEFLRQRRTDALILQLDATSDAELRAWFDEGVPIVAMGRCIPSHDDRCIRLDNLAGGYLATRHLLDRGHRRIAHISGRMSSRDSIDRLDGYRRALQDAGLPFDADLVVPGDFVEEGGRDAMQRLLEREDGLTAVFAANDQSAAGALFALRDAGLRVPEDVSLVGFDDTLLAHYLYPALTTVRQPLVEMGQAAAWLALASLGEDVRREVTKRFDPVLVERDSVTVPKRDPIPS